MVDDVSRSGESISWPNHLAALIQEARVARGMTLEELAERAGFGKNREKLTTILRGNWPKHATLVRVIAVLGISLEQVYPLPDRPTTGALLETMRLRRGMTLNAAGAAVGISGTQLRRIERNLSPNSPSIPALRAFYGVEHIAAFDEEPRSPLATALDEVLREQGLGLGDAAREADLNKMTILMVLRGFRPSLGTMKKLEAAFGLPVDLARAFDSASTLADQLQTRKWHSGLSAREFAQALGMSESSYTTAVANGVIGQEVQSYLANSSLVTRDAVQRAKSRYIQRMLDQQGKRPPPKSLLGQYIDEECIRQGVLPGDVACAIGINPSAFRKLRRGQIPRYLDTVERIARALNLSEQQRRDVKDEWAAARR